MHYLSLCCIAKDEDEYLKEWVDYHSLIGVEHFYIYDNCSRISIAQTLAQEVARGLVTVIYTPGTSRQMIAYAHCLFEYGKASRWIGFVDVDEFIVPKMEAQGMADESHPRRGHGRESTHGVPVTDLRQFLVDYERFGGLGIHWLIFGSSGHLQKPAGTQADNYLYRTEKNYPDNRHIKSVVQTRYTLYPSDPHSFVYRRGYPCVNEKFIEISGPQGEHSSDLIQINHYFCRSRAEFMTKLERGRSDGGVARDASIFDHYDQAATVLDTSIVDLIHYKKQEGSPPEVVNCRSCEDLLPSPGPHLEIAIPLDDRRYAIVEVETIYSLVRQALEQQDGDWVAVQLLGVAIRRYPDFLEPYELLSDILMRNSELDIALQCLEQALNYVSQSPAILKRVAYIKYQKGEWSAAKQAWRDALRASPQDVDVLLNLGVFCYETGDYEEAFACLWNAVCLSASDPNVFRGMVQTAQRLNDVDLMRVIAASVYASAPLEVLSQMLQQARQVGDVNLANHLRGLHDRVQWLIQQSTQSA